jgi:phosphoribosylglycinamide formyltransferase 1
VSSPLAVAILVSGEGTTLDDLVSRVTAEGLPIRFVLVASDRADAPALDRARRRGLETLVLAADPAAPDAWAERLTRELEARGAQLVVLAGFLRLLPRSWTDRWAGRAINVHPSLLPKYGGPGMYGMRVHRAVLAHGEPESGATVHLVTSDLDRGPVLAQRGLAVHANDSAESLRRRIHPLEVSLLAETLRRFAAGSLPLPFRPGASPA